MKRYVSLSAAVALAAAVFIVLAPPSPAEAPQVPRESSAVTVLFLGDIMLDRSVREVGKRLGYDYIFEPLRELLQAHDIVVFNLEGPVTDNPSVSAGSVVGSAENYVFTFDPKALEALASAGGASVLVAHLGNNHIFNFGAEGVERTEYYLKQKGIFFFGSPLRELEPAFLDTPAGPLALVSYNQFGGFATSSSKALRGAAASGAFPVLFAHWGEEYATGAPSYVEVLAREFAQAGARLVVGSHPHVLQAPGEYRAVPLYYSLGNAVFDQYWDERVSCGAALSVTLQEGGIAGIKEIPLKLLSTRQTTLARPGDCTGLSGVVQ